MSGKYHIPDDVTAYNVRLNQRLQRLGGMDLKRWKLVKGALTTVAVTAFSTFAILEGADPTTTGLVGLLVIAAINGIDIAELLSAYAEVKTRQPRRSDDDRE